ncbi:MAG: HigA family addiction module antidote protein [Alphaproteobacteria bacterium]|nr:HigA family addiction module antidote protein [Alphaproteobacteria bacterium]
MLAVHPGQALRLEIDARGLSANALALALRVPSGRITEILGGKRAITPETALRLGRYFGTGPELWLNLQTAHDLAIVESEMGERIVAEVQPAV